MQKDVGAPEYQEEGRRKQRDSMRRTLEESAELLKKEKKTPMFKPNLLTK